MPTKLQNTYDKVGANIIPADTKRKEAFFLKSWKPYQSSPVPLDVFERWKELGLFAYGIAAVLGLLWRDKYAGYRFILIDIDRKEGVTHFSNARLTICFISSYPSIFPNSTLRNTCKNFMLSPHDLARPATNPIASPLVARIPNVPKICELET